MRQHFDYDQLAEPMTDDIPQFLLTDFVRPLVWEHMFSLQ